MHNRDVNVFFMVIWKACIVCYPFGRYSDYEDMPRGCDDDYIRRNFNIMLDACLW